MNPESALEEEASTEQEVSAIETRQDLLRSAGELRPTVALSGPTRLLFACHAENVQSGQPSASFAESGLSALGWEQTVALAGWLHSHEEISAILTDTRLAARLTAQRIGQQLRLPIQIAGQWPRTPELTWDQQPPFVAPNNHSLAAAARYTEYSNQVVSALAQLLKGHWGSTLLFVTDAVTIATVARSFAGSSELGVGIGPSSLCEFSFFEGRWVLAYTNRCEHLPRRIQRKNSLVGQPGSANGPGLESLAEIEKIAHFYNQVALRLTHGHDDALKIDQYSAQGMNGEQIRDFAGLGEKSHLLLAGAGHGHLALELAQAGIGEVVGVDVSPVMLEKAEFLRLSTRDVRYQRVNFRLAPVHDLPFQSGRFDVALLIHLLHHLADIRPSLRELHRVLPAHGRLVVIDVDAADDAVKRATQNAIESKRNVCHASLRTGNQLALLLDENGFQVEKQQHWKVERSATGWLDSIAVDETTRTAVMEMLEASIETDAAGLNVRRQGKDLRFDVNLVAFLAHKVAG